MSTSSSPIAPAYYSLQRQLKLISTQELALAEPTRFGVSQKLALWAFSAPRVTLHASQTPRDALRGEHPRPPGASHAASASMRKNTPLSPVGGPPRFRFARGASVSRWRASSHPQLVRCGGLAKRLRGCRLRRPSGTGAPTTRLRCRTSSNGARLNRPRLTRPRDRIPSRAMPSSRADCGLMRPPRPRPQHEPCQRGIEQRSQPPRGPQDGGQRDRHDRHRQADHPPLRVLRGHDRSDHDADPDDAGGGHDPH
jgi:hypothetical protein